MGFQGRLDDFEVTPAMCEAFREASGQTRNGKKLYKIQLLRLGYRIIDIEILKGDKAEDILCGLLYEGVIPQVNGIEIKKDYILKNGDRIYLLPKIYRC